MTFTPKEVILGATLPLENGSTITFSIAGHVEAERDYDDAVVIFGRKLLKYTNSASDADRLTVRQVVASITSTPLDKVPDVGTPTSPAPVKEPAKVAPPVAAPAPVMGPAPTAAEQAAAAVAQCIKPPATAPKPRSPRRKLHRRKVSASVQSAARPCLRTRRNSRSSSRARRSANNAWRRRDGFENDRPDPPDSRRFY
jgi:hypothetical protein